MWISRSLFVAPAALALTAIACSTEVGSVENSGSASEAVTSCASAYYQCGGQGWTGPTCCVSSTCTYQNAYYSQCIPGGSGSSSGGSSSSSSGSSSGSSSSSGGTTTGCPTDSSDAQERAAANAAFAVLKATAVSCNGVVSAPCWASTILASQRYTLDSAGATIIFDSSDPQYSYVPQTAKAALAIAQLDTTVAAFLVNGLTWSRKNTNGQLYPSILAAGALANFVYPGNATPIPIQDPQVPANTRTDIVTGTAWCNTEGIHFLDMSSNETGFAPINEISYTNFLKSPNANFKSNGNQWPSTPFNGGETTNPYLVVSSNGNTLTWHSSAWPTQSCSGTTKCSGTIDLDPIPYTQPAAYYDPSGNLVGPQANPFALTITNLYADPAHAGQWATRTVSGVQQWGTFSTPVTVLGSTVYEYVKQM
jgi:hypothetical protein